MASAHPRAGTYILRVPFVPNAVTLCSLRGKKEWTFGTFWLVIYISKAADILAMACTAV